MDITIPEWRYEVEVEVEVMMDGTTAVMRNEI